MKNKINIFLILFFFILSLTSLKAENLTVYFVDVDKIMSDSNVGKNSYSFEDLKIKETLNNISECDLYIGNDTGWAHISVALNVKALTIFCDSPVMAYGRYSARMFTIEPEGEKNTTSHDTLGKDKISFKKVLDTAFKLLN